MSASAVAPFVYMDNVVVAGVFGDNGFHMRPDTPVEITFTSFEPSVNLIFFKGGLTIRLLTGMHKGKAKGELTARKLILHV